MIEERAGRLSYAAIGRRLDRSAGAVQRRAADLGLTHRFAEGLLTTGDAARLCGVSRVAVGYWCDRGLPSKRTPTGDRARLIHPADLLVHVRDLPTWERMSAAQRRRLEHLGSRRQDARGRAA